MNKPKQSLLDRLASGEIKLPTETEAKANLEYNRGIEETIKFMEETRAAALATPRKPGRPNKITARRITEVRGLRLESIHWKQLEQLAEQRGSSTNRLIEESILAMLSGIKTQSECFCASVAGDYRPVQSYQSRQRPHPKVIIFELAGVA